MSSRIDEIKKIAYAVVQGEAYAFFVFKVLALLCDYAIGFRSSITEKSPGKSVFSDFGEVKFAGKNFITALSGLGNNIAGFICNKAGAVEGKA